MKGSALMGRMAPAPPYLTDSLCVRLPDSDSVVSTCHLLQELEKHGEVSRVEVLVEGAGGESPGERNALVSFFDVRAAEQAQMALGDICAPSPSHGHRVLRLLGDASIACSHLDEVANIENTEEGDFLLEFFDARVAAKAAANAYAGDGSSKARLESAGCTAEDATAGAGSDVRSGGLPPSSVGAGPTADASRKGLAARMHTSQLNWEDLAAKREHRTVLLLRGLPKALCDETAFRALLSTKDMLRLVRRVKVPPTRGRSVGCVLVEVNSVEEVPKVAKFFHGRQFGGGHSVAVSFPPAGQRSRGASAPGPATAAWKTVRDIAEEHRRGLKQPKDRRQALHKRTQEMLKPGTIWSTTSSYEGLAAVNELGVKPFSYTQEEQPDSLRTFALMVRKWAAGLA